MHPWVSQYILEGWSHRRVVRHHLLEEVNELIRIDFVTTLLLDVAFPEGLMAICKIVIVWVSFSCLCERYSAGEHSEKDNSSGEKVD